MHALPPPPVAVASAAIGAGDVAAAPVVLAFASIHPMRGDAALAAPGFAEQQAEALAMEHAAIQAAADLHAWALRPPQRPQRPVARTPLHAFGNPFHARAALRQHHQVHRIDRAPGRMAGQRPDAGHVRHPRAQQGHRAEYGGSDHVGEHVEGNGGHRRHGRSG